MLGLIRRENIKAWKAIAIRSMFFGIGFAVTIAVLGGAVFLYIERPKPWNNTAITAQYDEVGIEGEKNTFVFYYTLQNNTKKDYSMSEYSEIPIFARLADEERLSGSPSSEWLTYDKLVFIPAGHKIRFAVHLQYPYPESPKKSASREEKKEFRKKAEQYVSEEFRNLDGFVLFDKAFHYEIRLNRGWTTITNEETEKK